MAEEEDAVAVKAAEEMEGGAPYQGEEPKADSIPDAATLRMGVLKGMATITVPQLRPHSFSILHHH